MTTRPGAAMTFGALRSPSFTALWLAQVASRFGDPITLVALAYVSYVQTRSALITALAVVIATVPNALFGVFGGAIADAMIYSYTSSSFILDGGRADLSQLPHTRPESGSRLEAGDRGAGPEP